MRTKALAAVICAREVPLTWIAAKLPTVRTVQVALLSVFVSSLLLVMWARFSVGDCQSRHCERRGTAMSEMPPMRLVGDGSGPERGKIVDAVLLGR